MRSRFSAYALGLADYIIRTTHPSNPELKKLSLFRKEIDSFSKNTQFLGLKILEFVEENNHAFVSFIAYLEQNGPDVSFQEKSYFLQIDGKWFYASGEIQPVFSP